MKRFFFRTSHDAQEQIEEFFHFMWPTAAALWNLRWQVTGYTAVHAGWSEDDLQNRFVLGSGIHGASIEEACIRTTWEQNKDKFSQYLLFQTFGIYESWIADLMELQNESKRDVSKWLQFPTNWKKKTGIQCALSRWTSRTSAVLTASYYNPRSASAPFDPDLIERQLVCYRAFKECRNCYTHDGGFCTPLAKAACDEYLKITNPAELDVPELPEMSSQVVAQPVLLSLRGCVGFTHVVQKLIATIDLELSRALPSEEVFIGDLLKRAPIADRGRPLPSDKKRRRKKVGKLLYGLSYPRFGVTDELCDLLNSKRLITY